MNNINRGEDSILREPLEMVNKALEAGKQVVIWGDPREKILELLSEPEKHENVINSIPITPVLITGDFFECAEEALRKVGHKLDPDIKAQWIDQLNADLGERQFSIVFYNNGENIAVQLSVTSFR